MTQARMALERANEVRVQMAQVKVELATRRLRLADALEDERAQRASVAALVQALPRWGERRTRRVLVVLGISDRGAG
jgi:hypothetical protein